MTDKRKVLDLINKTKNLETISITPTDDQRQKMKEIDAVTKRLTRSNKSATSYIVIMSL
jgi:hypothetical protein